MDENIDCLVAQVFGQAPGGGLALEAVEIQDHYKIIEKGKWLIDPMVSFRYRFTPDFQGHTFGWKLILGKDLGRFNVSLNPGFRLERQDTWAGYATWAGGISYTPLGIAHVGVEIAGDYKDHTFYGPVLSHGFDSRFVTLSWQMKDSGTETRTQVLVGATF
jgi:hypothetical protein